MFGISISYETKKKCGRLDAFKRREHKKQTLNLKTHNTKYCFFVYVDPSGIKLIEHIIG